MSTLRARLSRGLRDIPLARAAVVRLRTLGKPRGGDTDGVLVLFYPGVHAADRRPFERQLRQLRQLGDIIGLSDTLRLLANARGDGGRVAVGSFA